MEDNINYLIKIGWQPLGELKIIKVDRNDVLMQQLTKGEDK